jgi:2-hydroxy-3-oxopropionate reductase
MTAHPTLAYLGTGLMGLHQARNLLRAGFPLTAWNRTRAKAEPLVADGARVTDAAPDAAREAEIVVLMLENGQIVEQVLFGSGVATMPAISTTRVFSSSSSAATASSTRKGRSGE